MGGIWNWDLRCENWDFGKKRKKDKNVQDSYRNFELLFS